LSLVKELVDRYKGSIEVLDRVEGEHTKGTRFRVKLPLAPVS
jgi:signal transduction histidine kinase